MRRTGRESFSFVVSLLLIARAAAYGGESAADILEKVQGKYESIRDASLTFTRHVVFGVTQTRQDFAGTLAMKKGNRYRIELEDQTIVTDGKSVWTYSKINNQVFVDAYKEDSVSFSPDRVLVNAPENYTAAILGKEEVGKKEASILKLVPKSDKSNLKWMKVWVDRDEWLMRKIQLLDIADNLTTYEVGSLKLNAGLPDSTFRFTPPPGVEVIDVR